MYNYKIGETIKELRNGRGMTQETLANRIGVTKSMVSAYENSSAYPSFDVLISLARVFNVTTDYLLGIARNEMISIDGLTKSQIDVIASAIEEYRKANGGQDKG